MSLTQYQKLFQNYSPLKTDQTLNVLYENIFLETSEAKTVRHRINKIIYENYLNENVIKSAFVDKYLKKKSSRTNITIFELNAEGSRADLVVINGISTVYEIKTDFDTFERLDKQIRDYHKFFDYINVIVPQKNVEKINRLLPLNVGIISYYQTKTKKIIFQSERAAQKNILINPQSQLDALSKKELLALINKKSNCSLLRKDIISEILTIKSNEEINKIYREAMKRKYRIKSNFLYDNINNIYILDYQWFFKNNISTKIVYQ